MAVALLLWSSKNGRVTYNVWQSVYFQLIRAGFEDEEAADPESARDPVRQNSFNRRRQARITRMYQEIQEEIHGPDFRERAVAESCKKRAKAAPKAGPLAGKSLSSESKPTQHCKPMLFKDRKSAMARRLSRWSAVVQLTVCRVYPQKAIQPQRR